MGMGPFYATKKVLEKTGMKVEQMDVIEANEAFAAQAGAVAQELKFDMSKVNLYGGAIALGHPIGASGARILTTLVHALKPRRGNLWSSHHVHRWRPGHRDHNQGLSARRLRGEEKNVKR